MKCKSHFIICRHIQSSINRLFRSKHWRKGMNFCFFASMSALHYSERNDGSFAIQRRSMRWIVWIKLNVIIPIECVSESLHFAMKSSVWRESVMESDCTDRPIASRALLYANLRPSRWIGSNFAQLSDSLLRWPFIDLSIFLKNEFEFHKWSIIVRIFDWIWTGM